MKRPNQSLAVFHRGKEQLRVDVAEFKEHYYISIRIWAIDWNGNWFPVRGKGVSVRLHEAKGVAEALKKALAITQALLPEAAADGGDERPLAGVRKGRGKPPAPTLFDGMSARAAAAARTDFDEFA